MFLHRVNSLLRVCLMSLFASSVYAEQQADPYLIYPFSVYPFALPKTDADRFLKYREKWSRLTGFEHSGLHWQQFVVLFSNIGEPTFQYNYNAYLAKIEDDEDEIEVEYKVYPLGTILLKENYASHLGKPSEPLSLTIMTKRIKGYDPNYGDWEYLQTSKDGETILQGNSQDVIVKKVCIDCHNNTAERDFIFSSFYINTSR